MPQPFLFHEKWAASPILNPGPKDEARSGPSKGCEAPGPFTRWRKSGSQ
jgi:hypothetical protein